MKITNKYGLPDAIYHAALNDDYTPGPSDISATALIGPARKRILTIEYWDELEDDVMDRLWLLQGKAMHKLIEMGTKDNSKALTEERFYGEMGSWTVSGMMDYVQLPRKRVAITDWKVTSVWTVIYNPDGKADWEAQANIYRWLLEENGFKVTDLHIFVLFRDFKEGERKRIGTDYPQHPFLDIKVKKWTKREVSDYIKRRVTVHQAAELDHNLGNDLVECDDEERWYRGEEYAVQKPDAKRAYRTFKTAENKDLKDAEKFLADMVEKDPKKKDQYEIVKRPGSPIHCDRYCAVSRFCTQHARWKAANPKMYEEENTNGQ